MRLPHLIQLPPFDEETGQLNVIIETPRGCRNKFNYDQELGLFKLKKALPAGAVFPFDFGFVPGTLAEDGDPLDVLLLMEEPAFPGCLVTGTLIGAIVASQTKHGKRMRNDRLIAVANDRAIQCRVSALSDLNRDLVEQIEHFFVSYNSFEGKTFKPLKRAGPAAAAKLVAQARRAFASHNKFLL